MKHIDFDDINTQARAYMGVEEEGPPAFWVPAHVEARLVEMFVIVSKSGGRVGPKGAAGYWPSIFLDFADYVQHDHKQYLIERRAEIQATAERTFTSLELSRADEAMAWASRYLANDPIAADALQTWAFCKAVRLDIAKVLHTRSKAADAMLRVRLAKSDAEHKRLMDALRAKIEARWNEWASKRLENKPPIRVAARIREGAREKCRMELHRVVLAYPNPSKAMKRSDVMPGRVFTRRWLDVNRHQGAAIIAAALSEDGVIVR